MIIGIINRLFFAKRSNIINSGTTITNSFVKIPMKKNKTERKSLFSKADKIDKKVNMAPVRYEIFTIQPIAANCQGAIKYINQTKTAPDLIIF